MNDDEQTCHVAHAEQDEAVFVVGVVGVGDHECCLVSEGRLRLAEGDAVLGGVGTRLARIPAKRQGRGQKVTVRTYSVHTTAEERRIRRSGKRSEDQTK